MSSSLGCWKNWDATREVDGHFKAETNQTIRKALYFLKEKEKRDDVAKSCWLWAYEQSIEVGHRITSSQSIQSTHVLNCGWGNKNHKWVTEGQQQHLAITKNKEINTKLWSFYKNISTLLQLRLAFLENERPYLRLWVGVDNWDVLPERWTNISKHRENTYSPHWYPSIFLRERRREMMTWPWVGWWLWTY